LMKACRRAVEPLEDAAPGESPSLDAVQNALAALEEDECLNAGYGSNLTLDGHVECDAALMTSTRAFGSVGAVSGIRHPSAAARAILDTARTSSALGRVPALTLVGAGAQAFAREAGVPVLEDPNALVSVRARAEWAAWRARLADVEHAPVAKDTVGAVTLTRNGRAAAGVSSGGILLKHSGRIGSAATYGAGCWATSPPAVAVSVSGTGEHVMRAALARALGEAVQASPDEADEAIQRVFREEFAQPCIELGEPDPSAGAIVLLQEDDGTPRLWVAFTAPAMAVGYASASSPKPKAAVLYETRHHQVYTLLQCHSVDTTRIYESQT